VYSLSQYVHIDSPTMTKPNPKTNPIANPTVPKPLLNSSDYP